MKPIVKFLVVTAMLATWGVPVLAQSRADARLMKEAKWLTLEELKANPSGFMGQDVVFDSFFAQMGDVYRPFYTPFIREFYVNFWLWSPSARLWEPKEREAAFFFCFVERANSKALSIIQNLKRFDDLRVVAKVEMVSEGHAWLKVLSVIPTETAIYTDRAIKHIELGMRRLELKDFSLAGKFFQVALQEQLPQEAMKLVYRQAGVTFYELKEFSTAEDYLSKALSLVTESDPMLNLRLGQSLLLVAELLPEGEQRNKKLAVAADQLESAISLEPNLVDAHAAVGLVYGLLGEHSKGLGSCRVALKLSPQHAQAFRNIAVIYHLKGDTGNAVLYYQKAILAKANEPTYHRELADVYMELKQYSDAETEYRNFVTLDSENPEAYWLRAQSRLVQNNVDGAIEDGKLAIEKGQDYYPAYGSLAEAYMKKKNYAAAQETLLRGLAIFTKDVPLRMLLAEALKKLDKYDDAAVVLGRVVELTDDNAAEDNVARYEWAKVLAEKPTPDYVKAIAELETTVRKNPNMLESRFLLGHLYVDTQNTATVNPQKALQHLAPYLKNDPKNTNALLFQGIANTQLGQYQKAIASYDEILAIDTTNPYAANNKANALCMMGKDAGVAAQLAGIAVAASRDNPEFLNTLSWSLVLAGDYDGAKSTAAKVLGVEESAEAYYHLALAEMGLGDIDSAADHVKKAAEMTKVRKDTTVDFKQIVAKINKLDVDVKKAIRDRERGLTASRKAEQRKGKAPGTAIDEVPIPVINP